MKVREINSFSDLPRRSRVRNSIEFAKGRAERIGHLDSFLRAQKCAQRYPAAVGRHRKLTFMTGRIGHVHADPMGLEPPSAHLSCRVHSAHNQGFGRQLNGFEGAAAAVAELERAVNQKNVESEKPHDGPCADQEKHHACGKADQGYQCHEYVKAEGPERPVRPQNGVEQKLAAAIRFRHWCRRTLHSADDRGEQRVPSTKFGRKSHPSGPNPQVKPLPEPRRAYSMGSKCCWSEL